MRFPLSSRQTLRVTPVTDGPTYLLAVPTVMGVSELNARMVESGILLVTQDEVLQQLQDLLPTVTQGQEYHTALGIIHQALTTPDAVTEADRNLLATFEHRVVRQHPDYAHLLAEKNRWWPRYTWMAAKMFLRAIECPDGQTQTWDGEMPDDLLAEVPREHFAQIQQAIVGLLLVDTDTKNSLPSGSESPSNRTNSGVGEPLLTALPGK